jgi:CspA family cold shock protein
MHTVPSSWRTYDFQLMKSVRANCTVLNFANYSATTARQLPRSLTELFVAVRSFPQPQCNATHARLPTSNQEIIVLNYKTKLENSIIMLKVTGTVKWFNNDKGFGIINQDNGGSQTLVHYRAIASNGPKLLDEGQKVSFGCVHGQKGPQAETSKLLNSNSIWTVIRTRPSSASYPWARRLTRGLIWFRSMLISYSLNAYYLNLYLNDSMNNIIYIASEKCDWFDMV